MRRRGASIPILAGLLLLASTATAAEAPTREPRMLGAVDAGQLYVEDATAVGDDFAYLGTHGHERLSLRWFDADEGRERRLAVVWSGEMPRALATAGEGVIFTGFRQRQGTEPWRSDGTQAGTRLIKEIHRGRQPMMCSIPDDCGTFPAGSDPQSFVTIGKTTFFVATHPRYGKELWRTKGTRASTRLVKDVRSGPRSGLAFAEDTLVEYRGELYFVADDGRHGFELWRTDGTRAGTRMVRDSGPGSSVAWWATPVVAGDQLYFTADREAEGLELWRTDGSRAGTRLVRDIRPGPRSSKPMDLTAVGDSLYFTARDRMYGRELWHTDGTAEGTALVTDLTSGPASSDLGDLVALGDSLYLTLWGTSDDPSRPAGLWHTDGTAAGTAPVPLGSAGPPATDRRWSEYPTVVGRDGWLYFTADDGVHGNEPWVTDGTTAGTDLLADIRAGPEGSRPEWLTIADSVLYFTAEDGAHGRQLWAVPLQAPAEEIAGT